jgi:hypothetical protein
VIGIDPLYFLDEMSQDEIKSIIEVRNGTYKTKKKPAKRLTLEELEQRVANSKT